MVATARMTAPTSATRRPRMYFRTRNMRVLLSSDRATVRRGGVRTQGPLVRLLTNAKAHNGRSGLGLGLLVEVTACQPQRSSREDPGAPSVFGRSVSRRMTAAFA